MLIHRELQSHTKHCMLYIYKYVDMQSRLPDLQESKLNTFGVAFEGKNIDNKKCFTKRIIYG